MSQPNPEIRHKRWRHKALGYEVTVLAVLNYGSASDMRSTVTVDRTQFSQQKRTWDARRFVSEFQPIGRPQKVKDFWARLHDD